MRKILSAGLVSFLIWTSTSFAAVAHVASASQRCDNATSCTETGLAVSGTNTILYVCAFREDSTAGDRVVSGITHNGDALTEIINRNESSNDTAVWYRVAPDAGTLNIVATWGGTVTSGGLISSVYQDAKQTAQPDASASNDNAAGTTVSQTITTVTENAMIYECYQTSNSSATNWEPDSGQTERSDIQLVGARVAAFEELATTATGYLQSGTTDGSGVLVQTLVAIAEEADSAAAQTAGFMGQ